MTVKIDMFKYSMMFTFHYMFYVKTTEEKNINFVED